MATRKKPATRWHDGTTPIEDLEPHERIAHEIVVQYGDLSPSVERIMASDLDPEGRTQALTAFRDSLGSIGDPNRDPRVAIANAGGTP